MTSPLRWLYGGSNRQHHLRMSASCAAGLAYFSTINPMVTVLGYRLQMPHPGLWLVAAVACYGQELWATADRDLQSLRAPKTQRRALAWWVQHAYWSPYGTFVSHRAALSHGLLIGTVARVAYGWWPVLLMLWMLWGVSPFWALWLGVAMGIGCLVNDAAHLLLDL